VWGEIKLLATFRRKGKWDLELHLGRQKGHSGDGGSGLMTWVGGRGGIANSKRKTDVGVA